MEKLSFVIPCYGSERTISLVTDEIRQTMEGHPDYDYEIILVNDCSPDGVWQVIRRLAAEDCHIRGINLARNFGQHGALMAGYGQATGDYIVSLDDDGQTPADEVFSLLNHLLEGNYDLVYGVYEHIQQNAFRRFGSWVNEKMSEMMIDKPRGLKTTSYFVARRFLIEEMLRYQHSYTYIGGLIFRSTQNISTVPVKHRKREVGHSGYTFGKLFSLWFNGFTAFSVKPLRAATVVGLLCALFGVLFGCYTVINKLLYTTQIDAGWSSIITAITFIGGMILFMLGLVGEYIGRIYICINKAPQYVIREMTPGQDGRKEEDHGQGKEKQQGEREETGQ